MTDKHATPDPRDALVGYIGSMRAFAYSLTRNDAAADDLVQDSLVKAWKNIESFERGTNMQAWLFTIQRNTFYSNLRKSRREVEDVDGVMAGKLSEKPRHDGVLALDEFNRAFVKLPVEQREALSLVGASGFSYEEAAVTCGVAVGTIKSRVNRGRSKLVEMLGLAAPELGEIDDRVVQGIVSASSPNGAIS
ncbi:MAG: sigma-70 family RNA polymerase sigma factor [Deltaproteobacteria bacterium]